MRAVFCTALVALTLAVPAEPSTVTGLRGHVTIGPLMPVCRIGTPCSGPAKNITLSFVRAGRTLRTKTDGAGNYRIVLARGTYVVRPSRGLFVRPAHVIAQLGRMRVVNLAIDTGIR